jgi:hypothetical protein
MGQSVKVKMAGGPKPAILTKPRGRDRKALAGMR